MGVFNEKNRYSKSHVVFTQKGLIVHGCTSLKDYWINKAISKSEYVYM